MAVNLLHCQVVVLELQLGVPVIGPHTVRIMAFHHQAIVLGLIASLQDPGLQRMGVELVVVVHLLGAQHPNHTMRQLQHLHMLITLHLMHLHLHQGYQLRHHDSLLMLLHLVHTTTMPQHLLRLVPTLRLWVTPVSMLRHLLRVAMPLMLQRQVVMDQVLDISIAMKSEKGFGCCDHWGFASVLLDQERSLVGYPFTGVFLTKKKATTHEEGQAMSTLAAP